MVGTTAQQCPPVLDAADPGGVGASTNDRLDALGEDRSRQNAAQIRYSEDLVGFRDHFSGIAERYAAFRPQYPESLFDWLASIAPRRDLAWDCACGSGQASRPLAKRLGRVIASDASLTQVSAASDTANLSFVVAPAEQPPITDETVDLVTVAQALHWFVGADFFNEVQRVLRPEGVFAAWTYGLPHVVSDAVESTVHRFIDDPLGPYWPREIRLVLDGYASVGLPFEEIEVPAFEMRVRWTLAQFLGFVRTWSGVTRYVDVHGEDPVDQLESDIEGLWGPAGGSLPISWRLDLRVGRV